MTTAQDLIGPVVASVDNIVGGITQDRNGWEVAYQRVQSDQTDPTVPVYQDVLQKTASYEGYLGGVKAALAQATLALQSQLDQANQAAAKASFYQNEVGQYSGIIVPGLQSQVSDLKTQVADLKAQLAAKASMAQTPATTGGAPATTSSTGKWIAAILVLGAVGAGVWWIWRRQKKTSHALAAEENPALAEHAEDASQGVPNAILASETPPVAEERPKRKGKKKSKASS